MVRSLFFLALVISFSAKSALAQQPKATPENKPAAKHAPGEAKAQRDSSIPDAVVPTKYSYDPTIALLPEPVITDIQSRFSQAIYLTKALEPEGNSLWKWEGDKKTLEKKAVQVHVTTSADPIFQKVKANFPADTDALTIVVGNKATGDTQIMVLLLADKFVYDGRRERSREEIAARMNVATAHELNGNVLGALEMDTKNPPKIDEKHRAKTEVRAFTAGIAFLEALMANDGFKDLGEREKAVYRERLANEKAGLASWSKQLKALSK
jgi:hypothetical protein